MTRSQILGARGETVAAAFLRRTGLQIVAQNWRSSLGEIDLVALEGDQVVVVEVKTRVGGVDVAPDMAVGTAKLARLGRLAEAYLSSEGTPDAAWRVDVIAIVLDARGAVRSLEHLRGAFL